MNVACRRELFVERTPHFVSTFVIRSNDSRVFSALWSCKLEKGLAVALARNSNRRRVRGPALS